LEEDGKIISKTYRMGSFGMGILIPDGDQGTLVFSCQYNREYEEYLTGYAGGNFMFLVGPTKPDRP